ncbi:NAD(P)/FAD-dependent oxidoreductase [Thermoleophilia bacterium SCSIO 60948]|nr:NAD(P)/FAD-dependent oxidoreductase [Thermoleophilia bacterium SCSIO 60948]
MGENESRQVQEVDVAILGAGFSGLGMAIELLKRGREDFVILERGADVGGTWEFNTYPGCACDVPSNLYSFSFAPNPDWKRTYSRQPQIREYLHGVADRFGVRDRVRTNTQVTEASWSVSEGRWDIETSTGPVQARVLITGAGPLADPKLPDVPGIETFEGHSFHSARWDHDYDLRGKRVAAIGTGASAIQFVPEIQPQVAQLHVIQRTPPWILPHTARPVSKLERALYRRLPVVQRIQRGFVYTARELLAIGFTRAPKLLSLVQRLAERHMDRQISDPELRRKVQPDYTIGCKRILPSNKWYPALGADNVELHTGGVKEFKPHSIVTGDGTEIEVDAVVYGTGFQVTDMPIGHFVRGRDGNTLAEHWNGSPRAHLGMTVSGFPNLFLLLGPNTGLGHSSMVYMIESQIARVAAALETMDERAAETIEVSPEAERRFTESVDERMQSTVWNSGCSSWYIDQTGRNSTLWPDFTFVFRRDSAQIEAGEFEFDSERTRTEVPA